jgi:hypothetical protein
MTLKHPKGPPRPAGDFWIAPTFTFEGPPASAYRSIPVPVPGNGPMRLKQFHRPESRDRDTHAMARWLPILVVGRLREHRLGDPWC